MRPEQVRTALEAAIEPGWDAALGGAILAGWAAKGPTAGELASAAAVLRAHMRPISWAPDGVVDTCGTGGGVPTWNLSTGAAIVAAAAGAVVAKHGNRAVTSVCGSADVLEALGVSLAADPVISWSEARIAFLFAPDYHPALAKVAPIRRALGIRTVFNVLGPLLNPTGARRQVIGVWDPGLLDPVSHALAELGADRALVVCSPVDGGALDEVSPVGVTWARRVVSGSVESLELQPRDFGLEPCTMADLMPGLSVDENADRLLRALDAEGSEPLLPSAAATLWAAGQVDDLAEGARRAGHALCSGAARRTLERWKEASQR